MSNRRVNRESIRNTVTIVADQVVPVARSVAGRVMPVIKAVATELSPVHRVEKRLERNSR